MIYYSQLSHASYLSWGPWTLSSYMFPAIITMNNGSHSDQDKVIRSYIR